jgi:diadenosine tetraphosphate (Ap4A) HIT family hydrolase
LLDASLRIGVVGQLNAAAGQGGSAEGFCFLCEPSTELVFLESQNFYALAGLGPVVDGYSVIAAKAHSMSMADIPPALSADRDAFLADVRTRLVGQYGSCLITEHGRMAVCAAGEHDHHCFHAHFLAFPGTEDVSDLASSYFANSAEFSTLEAAFAEAVLHPEYLLISPNPNRFYILSTPLNAPRQLARHLVSWKSGNPHLADWKTWPQRERAILIAQTLRATVVSEHQC